MVDESKLEGIDNDYFKLLIENEDSEHLKIIFKNKVNSKGLSDNDLNLIKEELKHLGKWSHYKKLKRELYS